MTTCNSISFAGCGFLMSYHVGVAMCLRQYAPEMILGKICSTSSGLLVAVSLICDIPLGVITTEILRITNLARSFTLLGPLDPRFNLHKCLEEVLRNHLPDDAHERASGRLFISLTRIRDKTNVILSQFQYREQLIKAVLAGCFIPTYSGLLPPPFMGVRYIDGSVTNNLPVIDQNTVRVSPFSGEADICPSSPTEVGGNWSHANLLNMVVDVTEENLSRFFRVFIPQDPAAMIRLCQQGFDDALGYLQRNKKSFLAKSFFVTSTFLIIENGNDDDDNGEREKAAEGDTDSSTTSAARLLTNINSNRSGGRKQWATPAKEGDSKTRIDSSVLSQSESVLKKLSISNNNSLPGSHGDDTDAVRMIRPVDLIVANLKSIAGNSVDSRSFQMRLPKYEPPLDSKSTTGHVSAYFKRYLLHPVTQLLSDKICEASRVVLAKVNKRVNVEALTELLMKRPERLSAPEEITLLKHILQMTNEQAPFETVYYLQETNTIHVTELFDVSDCEDTNLQTDAERELNQMLEFDIDDWGDAEFGGAGWDGEEDFPDDDLFPVEEEEEKKGKQQQQKEQDILKQAKAVEIQASATEEDDDVGWEPNGADDDLYSFGDMASKALNMSHEYNEMLFGPFRHIDGEEEGQVPKDDIEEDENSLIRQKETVSVNNIVEEAGDVFDMRFDTDVACHEKANRQLKQN